MEFQHDLLLDDEPPAVEIFQGDRRSPFLLLCDHASNRIPRQLGQLGLDTEALHAHIAWDIGAAGLARELARLLGAPLYLQGYSRLVIDCNRPLAAADSIPETSGGIDIPGNRRLTEQARALRAEALFKPYHAAIERELEDRASRGEPTALVTVHSYTPVLLEQARRWHTGILYNRDQRLAAPLLQLLRQEHGVVVGENEPYSVSDTSDFAINVYGEQRGNPYVEIEVRQDLIAETAGQIEWAARYARLLLAAGSIAVSQFRM